MNLTLFVAYRKAAVCIFVCFLLLHMFCFGKPFSFFNPPQTHHPFYWRWYCHVFLQLLQHCSHHDLNESTNISVCNGCYWPAWLKPLTSLNTRPVQRSGFRKHTDPRNGRSGSSWRRARAGGFHTWTGQQSNTGPTFIYRDRVFGLWEEAGEPGENMQVHPERRS